MRKSAFIIVFALVAAAATTAAAQNNFFPGDEYFSALRNGKIVKVEFFNDRTTDTLFDASGGNVQSHILSPDGRRALLISQRKPIYRRSFTADYSIADFRTGSAVPLSTADGSIREASFSPDGHWAAFVRGNDIFAVGTDGAREIRITSDGRRNSIINGAADWVYEEEYGFTRAYEFSPDSRLIAFLRFDESRVREFSMMRYDGGPYSEPQVFKYPKAGEENSIVTLHVYDIPTGSTYTVDTGPDTNQYIPRIGWTPSGELFFYRVNRRQNHFDVLLADGEGKTRVIYDEVSPRYVERPDDETVTFLADGDRFIVKNETRTGWMHLYLHSIRKGFLNAITSGEWEVTELLGIRGGRVWYMSSEASPLERHLYSVKPDGRSKKRLTGGSGTYRIVPTPELKYYTSTFTDAGHRGGVVERVKTDRPELFIREKADLTENEFAPEFFSCALTDGTSLYGYMIKPRGFDPSKRYPVFMTQYSGPGSQSVADRPVGAGDEAIFAPLLEAGYIVACVDGRGTGFRGEEFKKCTYGQLGKYETEDQIAAAHYLGSLPYVNESRIGIYGWSYGGFMALNCILKGADVFKLAVAVAPVTSWRYYDTIYTEIYNGLPQDNPSGYDDNSPINFAALLEGKLLLVHGTADDNVHVQNSYEMAKALIAKGKQFDIMIYPDDNHSMRPGGGTHVRRKIVDYVTANL